MPEHLPGEFYDEGGEPIRERPSRRLSFEERSRVEAEKAKSRLTPDRIKESLPSEDLRNAFHSIKSATGSIFNLATLGKQQDVLDIREKQALDPDILKEGPLVYIGSGIDLEYPLTLGAKEIIMLDPIFLEDEYIGRLKEKINALSKGSFTEETENHLKFKFDFGGGPEEVSIVADPRVYGGAQSHSSGESGKERPTRFVPPEKISMFLVFQSEAPTADPESLEHLVPGGYILSNRELGFLGKYFGEQPTRSDHFATLSSKGKRQMIDELYRNYGFEPVSDPGDGDSYLRTFVRKSIKV